MVHFEQLVVAQRDRAIAKPLGIDGGCQRAESVLIVAFHGLQVKLCQERHESVNRFVGGFAAESVGESAHFCEQVFLAARVGAFLGVFRDVTPDFRQAEGSESLIRRIESRSGLHTLEYAEQIGLGSRNYTLVNLDTGGK